MTTEEQKKADETAAAKAAADKEADDKKKADAAGPDPEGDEPDDEDKDADDIDYDAELEHEKGLGKPDPKIAKKAFADRKKKRDVPEDGDELESDEPEGDEDEEDRPLTSREVKAMLAEDRKVRQETDALTFAKSLAGSDKEAALIVAKWKNRNFPTGLSLADQIQEAYAITHSKKIIGERNEAIRALGNRDNANRDASGSHRDAPETKSAPKIAPQDAAAIKTAGFIYNSTSKQFEKKLKSGDTLVQDPKTKRTFLVRKAK